MKPADYLKLENDKDFKKKYLSLTSWWKNILIIPSILFLFLGIFGMLYLLQLDLLLSYYVIPFVIIFLLGTIWLKSVKRHIYNLMLTDELGFRVCTGCKICENKGFTYLIFTNGQKRHNEHFIQQLSQNTNKEEIILLAMKRKQMPILYNNNDSETDFYVIAYPTNSIKKQNLARNESDSVPLLFVNMKNVLIIKDKDLQR